MKTEILKNNGNVSDVANAYDEEGNIKWWLELETEIMSEGIEWNIYFRNQNGVKDLLINNYDYLSIKLEDVIDSIIDDINELVTKLESEDEALEANEILNNSINQAMNEIQYDGSVNETTLEEIETNISLAEESRNKIELGTDIDTQLRFTIQKANRILQDS